MTSSKIALVTGAARGIGAAVCRRLADDGFGVVAFDSCEGTGANLSYPLATVDDLEQLVASRPDAIVPVIGDVCNSADLSNAVAVASDCGRLEAVVAAAAIIDGGRPLWQTPTTELEQLWATDLVGVWNTAQATVEVMLQQPQPDGRFVAVASAAGHRGLYSLSSYTIVKHAVVGLVRALAADLAGTGVAAVGVSPGSTQTAMLAATADLYQAPIAELVDHQMIARSIQPDEIAAAVALCCSAAGAALNGSIVQADGGFRG